MRAKLTLSKILKERGFTVVKSDAGHVVEKFDKTVAANSLWEFLIRHKSCRVVFNTLVKSGFIDLDGAVKRLGNMLESSKTSFTFNANCKNPKCKNILDAPNIAITRFVSV